jgi:hypothetical protein
VRRAFQGCERGAGVALAAVKKEDGANSGDDSHVNGQSILMLPVDANASAAP